MDKLKKEQQLFRKVYKHYSTETVKFFTWEKIERNDEKKADNRRTQKRP